MKNQLALIVFLSIMALPFSALALDPAAGKDLYLFEHDAEQACTDCHDDAWYQVPENRSATSFFELKGWVQGCNQEFPHGWFPEEEDDVAAYLNKEFYGFPTE